MMMVSDYNSASGEDHGQQERVYADCNPTFDTSCSSSEPHLLTQADLNYLLRDFNLFKKLAELLRSRLKVWNLLYPDIEMHFFRNRQNELK